MRRPIVGSNRMRLLTKGDSKMLTGAKPGGICAHTIDVINLTTSKVRQVKLPKGTTDGRNIFMMEKQWPSIDIYQLSLASKRLIKLPLILGQQCVVVDRTVCCIGRGRGSVECLYLSSDDAPEMPLSPMATTSCLWRPV